MRLESTDAAPTREQIRYARTSAGLLQSQACELVHLKNTARWSEYETGERNMDAARWELFLIKTNQHPEFMRKKTPGRKPGRATLEAACT